MTDRPWAAIWSVLSVVLVVGCSGTAPPTASLPPTASTAGPLLIVETRGGLCADGPCGRTVIVDRDGLVHEATTPPRELGFVDSAGLAALDSAIRTTDFTALRSRPFTGTCPVAFDGQELVFEFGAPQGIERIASCQVEIDYGSPLFQAAANAIAPFIALPGP